MATLSHSSSILLTLCFSLFFLLPSPSTAETSADLVKKLCGIRKNLDSTFCAGVMESDSRTTAATKPLAVAGIAIESVMSIANETRSLIQEMINAGDGKSPEKKKVLSTCLDEYVNVMADLSSSLQELQDDDKQTANYDVMVIGDSVGICETVMEENKIQIDSILEKNKEMRKYAELAIAATEMLGG